MGWILGMGLALQAHAAPDVLTTCKAGFEKLSQLEAPLVVPQNRFHNPVKQALGAGQIVYGNTQLAHDVPTAKSLGAGGHFIWVREGRGPGEFTPSQLEGVVTATHGVKPAITIVQLAKWNSPQIKPFLGLGVLGLAAPIASAEQARGFLGSMKFPPAGYLGLGPDDTTAFLADPTSASRLGNISRLAVAIIDSPEAAASEQSLRAILGQELRTASGAVERFDAVQPDPSKLSPEAIARVEKVARDLGIPLAGQVSDRSDAGALAAARRGYLLQNYGSDVAHVRAEIETYLRSAGAVDFEAIPRAPRDRADNPLYEAVHGGKLAVGFYSMGHDPLLTVEGTRAGTGNLFVWADGEHRPLDEAKLETLLRAEEQTPAVVVARVPHQLGADREAEAQTIASFIHLGVRGLIEPNVSTPEEARAFISDVETAVSAEHLPLSAVMKSVMIETKEGLDNLDAILDVVAAHQDTMWVHIGPFDLLNSLKARYGEQLTFDSPEFKQAKASIETRTHARGIALGGLALNRADAQKFYGMGYRVLTVSSDQEGINAGIDRFLGSNPGDPSPVQRERLVATVRAAASIPWRTIPSGRKKTLNDPENRATLNYLELSGPIDPNETIHHRHMEKQTTFILEGTYEVTVSEPGQPDYRIVELGPGDAITIPAETWHAFRRLSPSAVLIDVLTPGRTLEMPPGGRQ
jgi:2-keto-3-deoxy-L-rhamnonate aldolase RhmA/mannose-6-phosphate isomerase-like protein (cupin superfamily)